MLNISKIKNNISIPNVNKPISAKNTTNPIRENSKFHSYSQENLKAYVPSFTAVKKEPSQKQKISLIASKLDKESQKIFSDLESSGLLFDNNSNDGSSVLDNLYKIASEKRIEGLNSEQIIKETLSALNNPYLITQKFGDIPKEAAKDVSKQIGGEIPKKANNVVSSCCVVASMEFNLASRKPAEFTRFVAGLTSQNYSVDKNIKVADIAGSFLSKIGDLHKFNTQSEIKDWDNIKITVKPDRNAIVRARVQSSYKDPGERSCIDVLIQSALLNLGSQNTYDSLIDERAVTEFNNDNSGLTDYEKNFVEQIVFESPKLSVVYQNIDPETGKLVGYNCKPEETKQHILKSLELGQNVIIGYTHIDENNTVNGGHEITVIGYTQDADGKGYFVCNDTDDDIDAPVKISEEKLLPLIHHAGISYEALSKDDVVSESWRDILLLYKNNVLNNQ